ncbi:tRNA (guanine-N1)-methyltransferase [Geoglobus acetivorans]|uniref:tRNA (Guanine-N1)-methyltransferase n=1 Tax=Geoglobus acetivorans TaxID=565033 RepID=A0ABZ3H556_GEOAI|nr:tRNA (guanine-N1)-methyltransferase [Geoglobus acetivorans]
MRLKHLFVEFLKSRGIECISTNSRKVLGEDPIAYIARNFVSGKFRIFEGQGRFSFDLDGNRIDACRYVAWKSREGIGREEIEDRLGDFPYLVVDCSLAGLHSEKELRSLKKQVNWTLRVVREFMWDERYVVAGMDTGTSAQHFPSVEDFLDQVRPGKVILLDPGAEEEFRGENADCYIIGGIVDKTGNKRGTTALIYERLVKNGYSVERRKILLRGDVIGVPDRINHIAEIVLRAVMDGTSVEEAILSVQSRKIARWRLRKEIVKNSEKIKRNSRSFRVIRKSFFEDVKTWLNVELEDFYRCASDMGIIVVDVDFNPAKIFNVCG